MHVECERVQSHVRKIRIKYYLNSLPKFKLNLILIYLVICTVFLQSMMGLNRMECCSIIRKAIAFHLKLKCSDSIDYSLWLFIYVRVEKYKNFKPNSVYVERYDQNSTIIYSIAFFDQNSFAQWSDQKLYHCFGQMMCLFYAKVLIKYFLCRSLIPKWGPFKFNPLSQMKVLDFFLTKYILIKNIWLQ